MTHLMSEHRAHLSHRLAQQRFPRAPLEQDFVGSFTTSGNITQLSPEVMQQVSRAGSVKWS